MDSNYLNLLSKTRDYFPCDRKRLLIIDVDSRSDAAKILKSASRSIAEDALKFGYRWAIVRWHGCPDDRAFRISSQLASPRNQRKKMIDNFPPNNNPNHLLDADYLHVLDFMRQQWSDGHIVIITSNITNECRHINDRMSIRRSGGQRPCQQLNYNYLKSWDTEMCGQPSQAYYHLLELLERDGYVPDYHYRLRRPADGALGEYCTSYYLVRDWLGEPVRIGTKDSDNYRIIGDPILNW